MSEDVLALASRALGHAEGEAQATVIHERSLLGRYARSAPTQSTALDVTTIELLCVRDGHTASAHTTKTDDDSLRELGRRAAAAARNAAAGGAGVYPGLPAPRTPRPHDGHDTATAALDPARAGAALGTAFDVAEAHGLEAFGIWTEGAVETAIATTTGTAVTDAVTDAHFKVKCRSADGRSGQATATAVAGSAIDPSAVAEQAAAKVRPGELAELEPGEYPVVLDADAVGLLLEFLGYLAFEGRAHAEGRGALVDRLGARVAAPAINLSDSPRYHGTLPRAFDFEAVPKEPLALIQDGVAQGVVHDVRSAALAGTQTTGHALAPGGAATGPMPANMVLAGGDAASVEELAAPIERGLYVTRLWYVNTLRPKETLLTGMTRDGTFLIEDGQITRPLRDVRFTDSVLRILSAVEALEKTPRLVSEAEFYGARFANGVVCPALRAQGFRVTGATT